MKNEIHPDYEKTVIRCVCGAEFEVGSTKDGIRVEVCSNCHPFYTGQQRTAQRGGRVERFRKKYGEDYRGSEGEAEVEEEAQEG